MRPVSLGSLTGLFAALLGLLAACVPDDRPQPAPTASHALAAAVSTDLPLVVLDVRGRAEATLLDLERHEAAEGRVPDGAAVYLWAAPGVPARLAPELSERVRAWRAWGPVESRDDLDGVPPAGARRVGTSATGRPLAERLAPPPPGPGRRAWLLELGWDALDTATLRARTAELEQAPFDGVVLDARTSAGERLRDLVLRGAPLADDALDAARADLRATRCRRFQRNLLRLDVSPLDVTWAEDWSVPLANARRVAALVRDGGLTGILLDTEAYANTLWERGDPQQVRQRGIELGRALGDEHPQLVLLLTLGYSGGGIAHHALLPAFVNGLLSGLPPSARLIDGYEHGYGFKTARAFQRARAAVRAVAVPGLPQPRERIGVGCGLWLDFESGRGDWPARAHFAPEELEQALVEAAAASDGWVWLYSERIVWWRADGVPAAYRAAVERAWARAGGGPDAGPLQR